MGRRYSAADAFVDPAVCLEVATFFGSVEALAALSASTLPACRQASRLLRVPYLYAFVGGGLRCSSATPWLGSCWSGVRINLGTGRSERLPPTLNGAARVAGATRVLEVDGHVFVLTEIILRHKKGFALEAFDPRTRTWEERISRRQGEPDLLVQGDGSLFLSYKSEVEGPRGSSLELNFCRYSVGTGELEVLPAIPTLRCGGGHCVLEGALYVAGGYRFPDGAGGLPALADFDRLAPAKGAWERLPPMPTPRMLCRAVASGCCVYTVGGLGPQGWSALERFDPSEGTWTSLAPLPTPRTPSAQVLSCQGSIYVFGAAGGKPSRELLVERFDPGTGRWSRLRSLCGHESESGSDLGVNAVCYQDRMFTVRAQAEGRRPKGAARGPPQVVVEEYCERRGGDRELARLTALHGHSGLAVATGAE